MHAVNNGPLSKKKDQIRDNFDSYTALKIPYARNHDASFCADYGGCHTVDVHYIFPDFNAPVNDPSSYDFTLTDLYIQRTLDAGTETFYRLGTKIEHEIKKYGTLPPPDFEKWAQICEHIILHMNYGWADGHHFGITYWEIWNEPDIAADDADPVQKKCWGGTEAQFHDFYAEAASYLKKRFPELKIGGPAVTSPNNWLDRFLCEMQKRNIPIDFVSWHSYFTDPAVVREQAEKAREMMNRYGYENAESIFNEWNYVENWTDRFVHSIETINGARGAAFTAACMITGQYAPVDMMMYYDARPSVFNGLWSFYTARELHGYYPFMMFGRLFELGEQVSADISAEDGEENLYALAARGDDGRGAVMISSYSPDVNAHFSRPVTVEIEGISAPCVRLTVTDAENMCATRTVEPEDGKITVDMDEATVALIEIG